MRNLSFIGSVKKTAVWSSHGSDLVYHGDYMMSSGKMNSAI